METQITGETVGEVRVVADMHQRKAEMARHSDCFIALPGVAPCSSLSLSLVHIYIYIMKGKRLSSFCSTRKYLSNDFPLHCLVVQAGMERWRSYWRSSPGLSWEFMISLCDSLPNSKTKNIYIEDEFI